MPRVQFFASYDARSAISLEATELTAEQTTPQGLRETFFERTGLTAFVLHSDGLGLTRPLETHTVRLELRTPAAAASAYPPLPRHRPWQQPGWFRETLAWLENALNEPVTGLKQLSTNDLGAVLRLETATQTAYLKTSGTRREATLSARLAAIPDMTPEVLAWNGPRNLLLTRDCGARLSDTDDIELWRAAVVKLARFQRSDPAALLTLGCPTHPFNDLAERAARFLNDSAVLAAWGLKLEHIAALREQLPRIRRAHENLTRLELPLLPAHGDAHPMNVLTGCGTVLFDWSEASIAQPLLDIGLFLAWLEHPGRASLPLRQRHPDAAAELWQTYLRAARLSASGLRQDAMRLALLQRALAYHERFFGEQGTVPGWRPQHTPYLLRSLLRLL